MTTAERLFEVSPYPAGILRLHEFFYKTPEYKTSYKSSFTNSRTYFYNDGSAITLFETGNHHVSSLKESDLTH